jgi:phosphatidylserine decarboxylase
MSIPLTPFGRRELLLYGGGSLALLLAIPLAARLTGLPALSVLALLPAAGLAFTLQFFRDPERAPAPGVGPDALLSPADGLVADIVEVDEPEYVRGRATRIGIFMSPFNCHVNRFPADGVVEKVVHRAGRFLPAYDARGIAENEASLTGIRARVGGRELPILLRQVSGIAARRIVNPLAIGDPARRGERFGMIKFGSRCEVFVAVDAGLALAVRVGDTVYAGASPLGTLGGGAHTALPGAARASAAAAAEVAAGAAGASSSSEKPAGAAAPAGVAS